MKKYTVCIIGFGSRGLSIYERLVSFARYGLLSQSQCDIHIIDPGQPGVGIHTVDQPDFLTLNTMCGQLTMFTDELAAGSGPVSSGPNFYEWVMKEGYRLLNDGSVTQDKRSGRAIRPNDILPRRLLGGYLCWVFQYLTLDMPPYLSVKLHSKSATKYERHSTGKQVITLEDGTKVSADYVFITTGHSPNVRRVQHTAGSFSPTERYIDSLHPLTTLDRIAPKERVAILGFGLTAMDAISQLTLGRGGSYVIEKETGKYRYVPSGREPIILLASRSGIPYRTRPVIQEDDIYKQYVPIFFTKDSVDELRRQNLRRTGSAQLDFRADILPLLLCEMRRAYFERQAEVVDGLPYATAVREAFLRAQNSGMHEELLANLRTRYGDFPCEAEVLFGVNGVWSDKDQYHSWVFEFVKADLSEARAGKHGSPIKYALDLLRDLRNMIRYTVDFGSLTSQSHMEFVQTFSSRFNQFVIGPSLRQSASLLALSEVGIVLAPFGPSPLIEYDGFTGKYRISSNSLQLTYVDAVDWLCAGHVQQPSVEQSASRLIQSLYSGGHIQVYRNGGAYIGGVHLDRNLRPINDCGQAVERLWILGPLSEGIKYYNHYVAGPFSGTPSQLDAGFCVQQLARDIEKER